MGESRPELDFDVAYEAPTSITITAYDEERQITYMRLLDADVTPATAQAIPDFDSVLFVRSWRETRARLPSAAASSRRIMG